MKWVLSKDVMGFDDMEAVKKYFIALLEMHFNENVHKN